MLILVEIMFDDILHVSAGKKFGQNAIAFNIIAAKGSTKPIRYEPIQHLFIPDGDNSDAKLVELVQYVNLTVFEHPCIFPSYLNQLTTSTSSKTFQNLHQSQIRKREGKRHLQKGCFANSSSCWMYYC
jgi:hypothetical protein